jgi:hypothetical protein
MYPFIPNIASPLSHPWAHLLSVHSPYGLHVRHILPRLDVAPHKRKRCALIFRAFGSRSLLTSCRSRSRSPDGGPPSMRRKSFSSSPPRGIIDIPKVENIDPVRGAELAFYTALVSIINTKLPTVGELLLHQLVSQFRRASKTRYVKELLIAPLNSHNPTGLFAIPRPHL